MHRTRHKLVWLLCQFTRTRWRRALVFLTVLTITALFLAHTVPLPERIALKDSVLIGYQDGSAAHVFLSPDEHWRIEGSPRDVEPRYLEALIAYEDKRFWWHPGVDPIAIGRAIVQNLRAGSVVSGASTLTMQVVRILEPRARTLTSKITEALRAMQLEVCLSKDEILALYLRFAPFGKNIEGVRAASYAFFGHDARALSPLEIAYLVAVPQDPNARYPGADDVGRIRKAVEHVAERLFEQGVFSAEELSQVRQDQLPHTLRSFPRDARHASTWIRGRHQEDKYIPTSLDRSMQSKAARIMGAYHAGLRDLGIHNGSMVVLETESGKVRALVGNFDFWDRKHQGQVPGFLGPRSPGSALKPFIYTLAIDRGLILPSSLIEDVPVRYGGYEPRNYDERYRGLVRADDALSLSLNIPAVIQLKAVGLQAFLTFLQSYGITTLQGHERYGLSVAIGGLEMNLLELTNLYASLARGGAYQPWSLNPISSHNPASVDTTRQMLRAMSPGATFLTRKALRTRDRPDFPSRRRTVQAAGDYFWKTGTSYGHRDAWAVGSNGEHTVGVWLGNFDGTPSKPLVGGERAGPILFDMLDAITNRRLSQAQGDFPPGDLIEVEVCALSGHLPSSHCLHRSRQLAPVRSLPTRVCDMHVELDVDDESGHALCPLCRAGRQYTRRSYTVLPTSIRRWVKDEHLLAHSPPSHLPSCEHIHDGSDLRINQPQPGTLVYLVQGLDAAHQEIPLEAEGARSAGEIYWFVNGKLHARAAPDERVWLRPREGELEIRVVDSAGHGDQVRIKVMVL